MMIMKDSDHCENIDEHRKEMSIKSLNTRRKTLRQVKTSCIICLVSQSSIFYGIVII